VVGNFLLGISDWETVTVTKAATATYRD